MRFEKTIGCIGAGYVGGSTMAVLAYKCPHYKVIAADMDEAKIQKWNSNDPPFYEPGLKEIVNEVRGKNLFFTHDIPSMIRESQIIFVSVNTPIKEYGIGAGMAADLRYWEKCARDILLYANEDKIVVEKSTVPVRTAQAIAHILSSSQNHRFQVISNPEFLAEGTAIDDLLSPDRVLIGSEETPEGIAAREEIVKIYAHWVPREKIVTSNVWSSELSKLASNAFLAQRISSVNALTPLCEITGANIDEVSMAVGMDSRIGGKFLKASVGFGGSCFRKDILNLAYICKSYGLEEVAEYWLGILKINELQKERFVQRMLRAMFNTLVEKKIAIFGFAFKARTDDTRDSPAITVVKRLLEEKASISITDPKALENAKKDLKGITGAIHFTLDPYEAAQHADAIAVITEWDLYKELNYKKIFEIMRKPAFIFDGRNILDHEALYNIGFNVYPLGKKELVHFKEYP